MKEPAHQLLIKNMVCQRCILSVKDILDRLNMVYTAVNMGEILLPGKLSHAAQKNLETALNAIGFELIETRTNKLIEDIKKAIIEYINRGLDSQQQNLSGFITGKIHYDYSYLSDLFSAVAGKTIEQYFILQRVEKVKELLVYAQLSLTEISYTTGFSSVHHLSAQFKKVTGLTASHFKKIGIRKRKALDEL